MPPLRDPPRPPPPAPANNWALFLDVDGCLLDFADTPGEVILPPGLLAMLQQLSERLHGALALVSGRTLATIDTMFAPLQLPTAGLHGLERRSTIARLAAPQAPQALAAIRSEALQFAVAWPGVLIEDKGVALGLHWRGAPLAAGAMRAFAEAVLPRLPGYGLQHGNHVVELRPATGDKGVAISALLDESPFHGRMPVFVGDDLTDESGFAVINARNGLSVLVGEREPSAAHYALRDPAAVRDWLAGAGEMVPHE